MNGIETPWFGDLGCIQYKVLLPAPITTHHTDLLIQKPVPKGLLILLWDPAYIPHALLESDPVLLHLLHERAKINAKWNMSITFL